MDMMGQEIEISDSERGGGAFGNHEVGQRGHRTRDRHVTDRTRGLEDQKRIGVMKEARNRRIPAAALNQ